MIKHLAFNFITSQLISIFILMLSTFLIGYFSSWWLQKIKYKATKKRIKKKNNELKRSNDALVKELKAKNIETIFTEIKPKIIKVVEEAQEKLKEKKSSQKIAEQTRFNYIYYTKNKPKLDFNRIGHASKNNCTDLTQLNGIGPYIEQRLNEIGVFNFDQISRFSQEDIKKITELIDFFPGRIERDNWKEQAISLILKYQS